jgi:hypothetical protein
MTAVSATLPINPSAGATVIVDAFPEAAPGATLTLVPVIEKGGAVKLIV